MNNIQEYVEIALMAVGLFAAIAAVTPNKSDDSLAQKILDVINLLGLNVGKAKNKDV